MNRERRPAGEWGSRRDLVPADRLVRDVRDFSDRVLSAYSILVPEAIDELRSATRGRSRRRDDDYGRDRGEARDGRGDRRDHPPYGRRERYRDDPLWRFWDLGLDLAEAMVEIPLSLVRDSPIGAFDPDYGRDRAEVLTLSAAAGREATATLIVERLDGPDLAPIELAATDLLGADDTGIDARQVTQGEPYDEREDDYLVDITVAVPSAQEKGVYGGLLVAGHNPLVRIVLELHVH